MKNVNMIVAFSDNYVIGNGKDIPWRIPEDFKYFKEKTLNSTVIMGRKTFDSIGKPLPNRENIVLSRNQLNTEGIEIASSLSEAITFSENENIFIIGGSHLYEEGLYFCDKLYITRILKEVEGDVFFPYNIGYIEQLFNLVEHSEIKEYNNIRYQFLVYKKKGFLE